MKKVSFDVALAIKEAGYPQGDSNSGDCDVYPLEDHDRDFSPYTRVGKLSTRYTCETWTILSSIPYVVAPTYLDVWLWLWREKHLALEVYVTSYDKWTSPIDVCFKYDEYDDPEEAIIAAIKYLVENKLLK